MLTKLNFKFKSDSEAFIPHPKMREGLDFIYRFNLKHPRFSDLEALLQEDSLATAVIHNEDGIYEINGFNFDHIITDFTDWRVPTWRQHIGADGNLTEDFKRGSISSYGVADNVEQIKNHFKLCIESDSPFVISYTTIVKKNEPKSGGWRWHKWGEYIGEQNPQCEYLADEPEIDYVLVFHGYHLL